MILYKIEKSLQKYKYEKLFRKRTILNKIYKKDYSSNDYLGLSGSLKAKFWLLYGVLFYGRVHCKSKYLGGYSKIQQNLENTIAKAYNMEDSIIFSSGYLASIGVLQGIVKGLDRETIIIADKHIHASWIDAIFVTKVEFTRFNHNDINHLLEIIKKHHNKNIIILTEIVFSMHGTVIDITQYEEIAKNHNAILITDCAHSLGVLPCYKSHYDLHLQVGTFSKSCAGFGGYACGNKTLIEAISNWGKTQIYSTTLPEYLLYYNTKAFEYVFNFTQKNHYKMLENIKKVAEQFSLKFNGSAILIKEFQTVDDATDYYNLLLLKNICVSIVRPPTVPKPIVRFSVKYK